MSGLTGERCASCYGQGELPTDAGPVLCPDCGGDGHLPHSDTLVEWRLREIERGHLHDEDDTAKDIRWLAFQLRRARDALIEVLTLADGESLDPGEIARLRFVSNRALGMYAITELPDGRGED